MDHGKGTEDWQNAYVVPLYKGKAYQDECSNDKGIRLLNVPVKLYQIVD